MKQRQRWFSSSIRSGLLLSLLALGACGPQAFAPNTVSSAQDAAGNMDLPPKVDIVVGVGMSGTMLNIINGLGSDFAAFQDSLQKSGWDYRFVVIPLSEYMPVTSTSLAGTVSVSHYDTNYPLGTWLAPYPGADHSDSTLGINPSLFNQNITFPTIPSGLPNDGHETGVGSEATFLARSDVRNQFLRPDATLAVITISNGDDRSGPWPTDATKQWTPTQSYYNSYLSEMKAASPELKYYSVVAAPSTSCRSGGNWYGKYYAQFTQMVNGGNDCFADGTCVDLCVNPVKTALTNIQKNLATKIQPFHKKYLVVKSEPQPGSIHVTRHTSSGSFDILQDASNGWTYVGAVPAGGVYAIDYPIPMDLVTSGYLIELHGSAKLTNGDTATVTYMNSGTVISN